jgi:hypothetical protein
LIALLRLEEVSLMSAEIRAFRRGDGEQVTALVNAHVQAVLPGGSLPQNAVMGQLERDAGEFIVDPWVAERRMLVAEERGRIVAAALLHRYADEERVGEWYRNRGSIQWLVCWRDASYWPDAAAAGAALVQRCVEQLERWNVGAFHAGGGLPAPAVYGVPDSSVTTSGCWSADAGPAMWPAAVAYRVLGLGSGQRTPSPRLTWWVRVPLSRGGART